MRFIPVSIAVLPIRHREHLSDGEVIAEINMKLAGTGYVLQPLEPSQFVTAPAPAPKHNHHAAGRSPRQLARAKARVARLTRKGARR